VTANPIRMNISVTGKNELSSQIFPNMYPIPDGIEGKTGRPEKSTLIAVTNMVKIYRAIDINAKVIINLS